MSALLRQPGGFEGAGLGSSAHAADREGSALVRRSTREGRPAPGTVGGAVVWTGAEEVEVLDIERPVRPQSAPAFRVLEDLAGDRARKGGEAVKELEAVATDRRLPQLHPGLHCGGEKGFLDKRRRPFAAERNPLEIDQRQLS